jgi:hypothetical protein
VSAQHVGLMAMARWTGQLCVICVTANAAVAMIDMSQFCGWIEVKSFVTGLISSLVVTNKYTNARCTAFLMRMKKTKIMQ